MQGEAVSRELVWAPARPWLRRTKLKRSQSGRVQGLCCIRTNSEQREVQLPSCNCCTPTHSMLGKRPAGPWKLTPCKGT
eukprot:1160509-Pelagomonas_calceolata.AAC.2